MGSKKFWANTEKLSADPHELGKGEEFSLNDYSSNIRGIQNEKDRFPDEWESILLKQSYLKPDRLAANLLPYSFGLF